MAYGVQFLTPDGYHILSQTSENLIVREEFSIESSDWSSASFQNFQYDHNFATQYGNAPLVALRPTDGGPILRPVFRRNSSGNVFGVRFFLPDSIARHTYDVIVIGRAPSTPPRDGSTYGILIRDGSGNTLFDSRRTGNVSVAQVRELSANASAFQQTNGTPAARQTVSLPYNVQNAFYCLDNAEGTWVYSIPNSGFPQQGSVFVPSVQVSSLNSYTVGLESIRPVSGGSTDNPNASGTIIVFRYEQFG